MAKISKHLPASGGEIHFFPTQVAVVSYNSCDAKLLAVAYCFSDMAHSDQT